MKTKLLMFDIDGTLLDTTEFILQAYEHVFKVHKFPAKNRVEISRVIGKHLRECYQLLTGLEQVDHLIKDHKSFQQNNYHLAQAFLDTENTLKELKKRGIKLAAISTRYGPSVPETLKRNHIFNFFDLILTADEVSKVKPDPEGINKVLKLFSIEPSEAIFVGDSPVDVEAGKNANVKIIGVSFGFHGDSIKNSKPDFLVHHLSEILKLI